MNGQNKPVMDRTNVLYRREGGHGIKHFIFQNFHGMLLVCRGGCQRVLDNMPHEPSCGWFQYS